ncbi:hypothetical protein GQX73_g9832 [Xylaria multiplex]|uniref:Uncharacterized protein n=1 Tax=Xylaria multiplex TaxID=323545 RepID=A0A7C8IHF3_9PEZI|nr:hypothetical protein GQX73_g9832 [Xylaria multiplex]
MPYDRDAIARRLTEYYELLVGMAYLDPSVIQRPPPQGWSDDQLAVDVLRKMNRSDEAIDLLRHIPYIRQDPKDEKWEIYPETRPISYLRDGWLLRGKTAESCAGKRLHHLNMMPFDAEYPAGMISLTFGRDATFWVVDTDAGQMFPVGLYVIDDTAPESQPWRRNAKGVDILEYFDSVHSDLLNLKLVPAPRSGYWVPRVVPGEQPPEGTLVSRLLKEHGWPDNFQRAEYLEAVKNLRQEVIDESLNALNRS